MPLSHITSPAGAPVARTPAPTPDAMPAPTPVPLPAAALAACAAAASLPSLLAYNQPPSPTAFNQLAALALWSVALLVVGSRAALPDGLRRGAAVLAALLLMAGAAAASFARGSLPAPLATSAVALVGVAAVMVAAGAMQGREGGSLLWPLLWAWLLAGLLNTAIALVQVFAPGLADGDLIARSGLPGRAVGNMRQPNHLSSLLLWSAVAVAPLMHARRLPARWAMPLFVLLVFAISLTGSRTGGVGVGLLALWGLLDRRLSGRVRLLLLAAPLLYLASLGGMAWWNSVTRHALGAAARIGEADLSSSRFAIWANALALIRMHPWTGVGFGEFNFAWTLTPFPDRPVAFFDHTHNLPLQLAVELGLPLSALVMALLLLALWQAWRRSAAVAGDDGAGLRAAFVMVLMIGLHSLLEYPLWYAYFLLPAALAWGLCLGAGSPAADTSARAAPRRPSQAIAIAAGLVIGGSAYALVDYLRVVVIFAPGEAAAPLATRIADGRRSLFFAHHAEYAAATTLTDPRQTLPAFDRAAHFLLDGRLMASWARALAESGDLERARHVAARLREFGKPEAEDLFEPCDDPARAAQWFACQPPSRPLGWRDFVR